MSLLLKNAPALFQRMMNHILQEYLDDFITVYLDNIIIYSKTFEKHIEHIIKVLEKLKEANLMIKLSRNIIFRTYSRKTWIKTRFRKDKENQETFYTNRFNKS